MPKLATPELHGDHHPATLAWWASIWSSPMAGEYDPSDIHGLAMLADLYDAYWALPPEKAITKKELAGEIRLQRQCFGLSPIDRRRLQWEIDRGDEAQANTVARKRATPRKDPRLKALQEPS
jgi:hypothetical protein